MKTGKSLEALFTEVLRQRDAKKDYLADTRAIRMDEAGELVVDNQIKLPATDTTHRQIGEHLKIPAPYYDRMRAEQPALLATNVNAWFDKYPATRMLRTLDDKARAFLSNSFRPLDNDALAEAVIPPLMKMGVQVVSAEITERRFYLKVVDNRIERELKGREWGKDHHIFDTCCPAMVVSNSEIGMGRMSVETGVYTKVCTNLAVFAEHSKRKAHLGGRYELGDDVYEMLSSDTRKLTDQALWAQISDYVTGAFERARFDALCDKIEGTRDNKVEGDPIKTVELVQKDFGLNDTEKSSILQLFLKGGDLSQYGLHAAVTRAAEDLGDYDRASEFEKIGGRIIELPKTDWQRLAVAA